jgi:hypothetical protein
MSGSISGNGASDPRVVYGAHCTYWGPISSVGMLPGGLPCCPYCHGVLFEMETEEEFMRQARRFDDQTPGYSQFIVWLKGRKCGGREGGLAEQAKIYGAETGIRLNFPERG